VTANYVTVKEAARLTGKSPSSVRRVIHPIVKNDDHPDRIHIQPSVEEARKHRMNGETFAWRLSEELLRRTVKIESPPEAKHNADGGSRSSGDGHAELLAMLQRELDIKNHQITVQSDLISKQMELVTGLGERIREGNILVASLQQRLALNDGRDSKPTEPNKAKTVTPAKPEKGTQPSSKTAKPKKGFLSRIFR
jgi:hypothetical protein